MAQGLVHRVRGHLEVVDLVVTQAGCGHLGEAVKGGQVAPGRAAEDGGAGADGPEARADAVATGFAGQLEGGWLYGLGLG